MGNFTQEEARQNYIDLMGKELGEIFNLLWQEVVWFHINFSYLWLKGLEVSLTKMSS